MRTLLLAKKPQLHICAGCANPVWNLLQRNMIVATNMMKITQPILTLCRTCHVWLQITQKRKSRSSFQVRICWSLMGCCKLIFVLSCARCAALSETLATEKTNLRDVLTRQATLQKEKLQAQEEASKFDADLSACSGNIKGKVLLAGRLLLKPCTLSLLRFSG